MAKPTHLTSPIDYDYASYGNIQETMREIESDIHRSPPTKEKNVVSPNTELLISRIRLLLRIISFLISTSIVAILAYSAWLYQSTKDEDVEVENARGNYRSVWVSQLKMRPTYVLLGVSSVVALLNSIILAANFSKMVRRITDLSNFLTVLVSSIGICLWFGIGIWFKSDDWNRAMNMDITSYICRHREYIELQKVLGNMNALCGALRYAWWAVVLASSVELFSIATVMWGIKIARSAGVYTKL